MSDLRPTTDRSPAARSGHEEALLETVDLREFGRPDVAAPLIVWDYVRALETRVRRYEKTFVRIVIASGEDTSGGIPRWPKLDEWAERSVEQLRKDYEEGTRV